LRWALAVAAGQRERGGMERIFDRLERIKSLWKELELTKPDTSEYDALMNQIRVLSRLVIGLGFCR
jgi:hypothetical protein